MYVMVVLVMFLFVCNGSVFVKEVFVMVYSALTFLDA
jgi:hypothetical protein